MLTLAGITLVVLALTTATAAPSQINGTNSSTTIYVGTPRVGLSISEDNGQTWTPRTSDQELIDHNAWSIFACGNRIYVGTDKGLFQSKDNGKTWATKLKSDDGIRSIYASGTNIYVGLDNTGGLGCSVDDGKTWMWTNRYQFKGGLAGNNVYSVYISWNKI